jgi:hypothetical protein
VTKSSSHLLCNCFGEVIDVIAGILDNGRYAKK